MKRLLRQEQREKAKADALAAAAADSGADGNGGMISTPGLPYTGKNHLFLLLLSMPLSLSVCPVVSTNDNLHLN